MSKFEFLTSTRFWALLTGSASTVLIDPGFITQPWYITLGKFLGLVSAGFITIRTVDRAFEQKVLAAGLSSGKITTEQATDIPPQG